MDHLSTTQKGKIGESKVISEAVKKEIRVSIPFQEAIPYDLIFENENGLKKVQVKMTRSDGKVVKVKLRSTNSYRDKKYEGLVDFIICYDETTGKFFKVEDLSQNEFNIRLTPTKNNQKKGINWCEDYEW